MSHQQLPPLGTPYLGLTKEIGRLTSQWWRNKGKQSCIADQLGFDRAIELCPLAPDLYKERNGVELTVERLRVKPSASSMRLKPNTWPYRWAADFIRTQGLVVLQEEEADSLLHRASVGEFGMPDIFHYLYVRRVLSEGMCIGSKIGRTGQTSDDRRGSQLNFRGNGLEYESPYFQVAEDPVIIKEAEKWLIRELPFGHFPGKEEHFHASVEEIQPFLLTAIIEARKVCKR